MKLNIHIINDGLKKYNPNLYTLKDNKLTISQVRLPKLARDLEKKYIYIMKSEEIKKYHSFLQDIDIISIGTLSEEEKRSLSVIEISDAYDFATVFNDLQDIFIKYERWNNGLITSIASQEPLHTVANKAATVLDNPFVIFDVAFKLMTIGGNIPKNYEGTAWESVIDKEYVPIETFQIPDNDIYFFKNYDREIYYPQGSPYGSSTNVFLNLYVDNQLFAILAETDINEPFTKGQLSLLKHIRDILEFALTSNLKNKGSSEVLIYYIEKLLKKLPVEDKILRYYLEERGWDIEGYFCIYTLTNMNGEKLSDNQEEFCLVRIKKLVKDAIVFTFEDYIVLITKQRKNEVDTGFVKEMDKLLKRLELRAGSSHIFYQLKDLAYYYTQSKLAVLVGKTINPEKFAWNFQEYYFHYIKQVLNNSIDLQTLCHPSVVKLLNYDKKSNTEFIKCLQAYLANGCNISQTGKDLFIHRNTLVYRLEKIQEILEIDVQKLPERERMQLWFSCLLCNYL